MSDFIEIAGQTFRKAPSETIIQGNVIIGPDGMPQTASTPPIPGVPDTTQVPAVPVSAPEVSPEQSEAPVPETKEEPFSVDHPDPTVLNEEPIQEPSESFDEEPPVKWHDPTQSFESLELDYYDPVEYQVSVGFGGEVRQSRDDIIKMYDWHLKALEVAKRDGEVHKIYLSERFASSFGMTFEAAYDDFENIMQSIAPGRSTSSKNYATELDRVYVQAAAQSTISMLRWGQLMGDSSEGTEKQILRIKQTMPQDSRMDDIQARMQDRGLLGKLMIGMGGMPMMAASQLPRFIDRLKYGGVTAILGAGTGLAIGGPGGAVAGAKVGFLFGSFLYGTASEVGAMYDRLQSSAASAGIEIEPDEFKLALMGTGAAISVLDTASFAFMFGGLGATKFATALATGPMKAAFYRYVAKHAFYSYLEEGVTEGVQELLDGALMNWAAMEKENQGFPGMPRQSKDEMKDGFFTMLGLAGPLGFMGGLFGSSIAASRAVLNAKKVGDINVESKKAKEIQSQAIEKAIDAADLDDIDIADSEINNDPVEGAPGEPIAKVEPIEPIEVVNDKGKRIDLVRSTGVEISDLGGPSSIYLNEGVAIGEDSIHGKVVNEEGQEVYLVKENKTGHLVQYTNEALIEKTGLTALTLSRRASKAATVLESTEKVLWTKTQKTPMATIVRIMRLAPFTDKLDVTDGVVFINQDDKVFAVSNQDEAAALINAGGTIIGYNPIGEDASATLSSDLEAVRAMGWEDDVRIVEAFNAPAGTRIHTETNPDGSKNYFYYEGEVDDSNESTRAKVDELDAQEGEQLAEDEDPGTAAIDEEVEYAGEGQDIVEVLNQTDEQYNAGNIVRPIDQDTGLPYGATLHKRISYVGQRIRNSKDLARLFSIFRHPFIEHAHVVYMDAKGNILANSLETSGAASSVSINTKQIPWTAEALGASGVYMVHNHPTGNINPSKGDMKVFEGLRKKLGDKYKGAIILDHDKYSFIAPGQEIIQNREYSPRRTYKALPDSAYSENDIAEEVGNRGTALFVMNGVRKVRAVLTPNKLFSARELLDLVHVYGGAFYNIASDDADVVSHYKKVGKRAQGTTEAQMGRLMWIDRGDSAQIVEEWRGQLTGDKLRLSEQNNAALYEDEDDSFDTVPKTVKSWLSFWEMVKEDYNIKRPSGIHTLSVRASRIVDTHGGKMSLVASFLPADEGFKMALEIHNMDGEAEALKLEYSVVQGEGGLIVGLDTETEITMEQKDFAQIQASEMVNEIYGEGESYNLEDLDISEHTKNAISEYEANQYAYQMAPIMESMEQSGIKHKIMMVAEELRSLDQQGKTNTKEFKHMQEVIYRMAQNHAEYEGMSSKGLDRVKKLASDIAKSKWSPAIMQQSAVNLLSDKYDVRMPLTKKEGVQLKIANDRKPGDRGPVDNRIIKYSEIPGLDSLGYVELQEIKLAMENFLRIRWATTKMRYGDRWIELKGGIQAALTEFSEYNKDRTETLNPADAAKKRYLKQVKNFMKNFIVDRQMQYFRLIEHIAGPRSVAYQLLFRELNEADGMMRKYRQNLVDMFGQIVFEAGLTGKQMAKWHKEQVVRDGIKITNSQALHIYLNSLNEENWRSITKAGMYYSDQGLARHKLDPETVNFQEIANQMAEDPMAQALLPAYRAVFDSLGRNVKSTYESSFGREFNFGENYYPKKVASEAYLRGQDNIASGRNDTVTIADAGQDRISLVKTFLMDRTAGDVALELPLNGASEVLAISLEQETKFVHMEVPFYRASKLLFDPGFKESVLNTKGLGKKYYDLIERGLQDWAGRDLDINGTWDKVLLGVRRQATRAGLGLNPFTAGKAAISYFYALQYLDPRSVAEGIRRIAVNPNTIEQLIKISPVFRDRIMGNALPEMSDIVQGKNVKWAEHGLPKQGTKDYDTLMFSGITFVDKHTVALVMESAIAQAEYAFAQGKMSDDMIDALGFKPASLGVMTKEEQVYAAVKYAEWMIQRTQPDFRPQSRNAFQRGTPIERLASVFGSFVTITHNMAWDIIHRVQHEGLAAVGVKEIIWTFTLMMVVQSGNEGMNKLKDFLLGRDQATLFEMISRAVFNNTFLIRDVNEMFLSKRRYGAFAGKGGSDSYLRFVDQAVSGVLSTTQGLLDDNEDMVLNGLGQMFAATASFTGAPIAVMGYSWEVIDKKVVNK